MAAGGKRIGGGAGGGGNNQAVGALGVNEFLVDKYFKFNHLAGTASREHLSEQFVTQRYVVGRLRERLLASRLSAPEKGARSRLVRAIRHLPLDRGLRSCEGRVTPFRKSARRLLAQRDHLLERARAAELLQ